MKVMQGLPLVKEIEMLKETVQRKELSTSTEVEGEREEEKMMRRADPGAVRQDTKEVDLFRSIFLISNVSVARLCHLKMSTFTDFNSSGSRE